MKVDSWCRQKMNRTWKVFICALKGTPRRCYRGLGQLATESRWRCQKRLNRWCKKIMNCYSLNFGANTRSTGEFLAGCAGIFSSIKPSRRSHTSIKILISWNLDGSSAGMKYNLSRTVPGQQRVMPSRFVEFAVHNIRRNRKAMWFLRRYESLTQLPIVAWLGAQLLALMYRFR